MSQRRRTVLILDDFPDAAEALAAWFNLEGWYAQAVTSASEASGCVSQKMPDVLILEPHLRQGNGMAVAALARSLWAADARLIAITGHQREGDDTAYEPTLFNHTLIKPVSQEKLREVLSKVWPAPPD